MLHHEIEGAFDGTGGDLWNLAEGREKRWDALLAREITVMLPHELTEEEQRSLLRELAVHLRAEDGALVQWSHHAPDIGGGADPRQFHGHLLMTRRVWDAGEFTVSLGDWDDLPRRRMCSGDCRSRVRLVKLREAWADMQNRLLRARGYPEVSAGSRSSRGETTLPQVRLGRQLTALERQGHRTGLGDLNRRIAMANLIHRAVPEFPARDLIEKEPNWMKVYEALGRRALQIRGEIGEDAKDMSALGDTVRMELGEELAGVLAVVELVRPMVADAIKLVQEARELGVERGVGL